MFIETVNFTIYLKQQCQINLKWRFTAFLIMPRIKTNFWEMWFMAESIKDVFSSANTVFNPF